MENEVDQSDLKDKDLVVEIDSQNDQNPQSHKFRFGLLAVLFGSSLLILGRSLIDSNIGKPSPFTFPEQIEFAKTLKVVEPQKSEVIIDHKSFYGKPKYLYGQKYSYVIENIPVEISLRYLVGTEADLFILLKELGNIDLKEDELRQKVVRKDPIGFYAAFTYQDQAYLSACINPRGISTVTQEQFNDNASDRALDRDVIISWLLGQTDLRDRRCLWTLISTPITTDSNLQDTNQKLEKIWISWYEWWKPRFPQP